jgi:gamma-glutamyl hydrolase
MQSRILLVLFLLISTHYGVNPQNCSTDRPIIGIFTYPSEGNPPFDVQSWSTIDEFIVKWVESAGARVVPIPYDASYENLTYYFNSVNGLLFPGGGVPIFNENSWNHTISYNNVTSAANYLLNLTISANNNGTYFPIWAVCAGWEILATLLSTNDFLLDTVQGDDNMLRNISFTSFGEYQSKLWNSIPPWLVNALEVQNVTWYNHLRSIPPEAIYRDAGWSSLMGVSSVNYAGFGRWYVSSAEMKSYPIYGVQFHSEANPWLWDEGVTASHTYEGVMFQQYCANFFVNEARKNCNMFPNATAENYSLIYNWNSNNDYESFFFATVNTTPQAWPGLYNLSSVYTF